MTIRYHAMKPDEILEAIEKTSDPIAMIHQRERTKTIIIDEEVVRVPAPDNFAIFVELDSGKECVVIIEFDSKIDDSYPVKDFLRKQYPLLRE